MSSTKDPDTSTGQAQPKAPARAPNWVDVRIGEWMPGWAASLGERSGCCFVSG